MNQTKQQVDKHVASILGRVRDEKERNSKGYQVAKLYYNVKEYESARRYLAGFLSIKDSYAPAHKLQGQILEGLCQWEKAILAYKRSLELDDNQKEVLLKICELYCKTDIDPERAKYWAERAERIFPGHDTVFRLREHIYHDGGVDQNTDDLENLITSELAKRPKDVSLRAKLLRLFIDTGRVNEAYSHAVEVERRRPYPDSLEWYQCLLDVFQEYENESGNINGPFHKQLLSAQNNLIALSMATSKIVDSAEALYRFDQTLQRVGRMKNAAEEWQTFHIEMQAQLYFYAGTLLLKRAQQHQLNWPEACPMASTCYLLSYSIEPPNLQSPWYVKATEEEKRTHKGLHCRACYRASQSGHMIRNLSEGVSTKWIQEIKQQMINDQGRRKIFDALFILRNMKTGRDTSFLMTSRSFTTSSLHYPTENERKEYDQVAHVFHPESLHELVWIALQYYTSRDATQPHYHFRLFGDLQFTTNDLRNATPETLSFLDTEAFLYATVRCSALRLDERHYPQQPTMLPACLSEVLCTREQQEWWTTAYRLFTDTTRDNLAKCRVTLQRGLEAVRLVGLHGMDIALLVHLAKTFEERVAEAKAMSQSIAEYTAKVDGLESRAAHYWMEAITLLEKITKKENPRLPKNRLFEAPEQPLEDEEVEMYLEQGRYFLAYEAMEAGDHGGAVKMFEKLNMAEASYQQAQIYQRQAENEVDSSMVEEAPEHAKASYIALLTKARDALYLTMDRLRNNKHHELNEKISVELEEIETQLSRADPKPSGGGLDTSINTSYRTPERFHDTPVKGSKSISAICHSTPSRSSELFMSASESRLPTRPSPERLDAQIRSLAFSQEALVKHIIERNDKLMEQNTTLVEQLCKNRQVMESMQQKLEQFEKDKQEREKAPAPVAPAPPPVAPATPSIAMGTPMPAHYPGTPSMGHHPHMADPSRGPIPRMGIPPPSPYYAYGHPEYDYHQGLYSPHPGYPMYAPQPGLPMPNYGYPMQHPASSRGGYMAGGQPSGLKAPSARHRMRHAPDVDDDDDDDDESGNDDFENGAAEGFFVENGYSGKDVRDSAPFNVPDSQLVQDWPYGNSVGMEGTSTLTYSPPHRPMPQPGFFQIGRGGGPAVQGVYGQQGPAMPGPGFFSADKPGTVTTGPRFPPVGQAGVGGPGGAGAYRPPPPLAAPRPGFLADSSGVGTITNTALPVQPMTGGPATQGLPVVSMGIGTQAQAESLTGGSLYKAGAVTSMAGGISPTSPAYGTKFVIAMPTSITSPLNAGTAPQSISANVTPVVPAPKLTTPKERKISERGEVTEDEEADDSYQGPDFQPIIPLPDEVEVKTGEEGETVLFKHRTKLFRFTDMQWKERGLGDIKILLNEESGQPRVVMRREQIHKVCANFLIHPDLNVNFKEKEDKVLTWHTMDFSDGEATMEKFCCKFKTPEIANEFKAKFDEAKEFARTAKEKKSSSSQPSTGKKGIKQDSLMDKFKPKAGSWDCDMCLVNNTAESVECVACNTVRPGHQKKELKKDQVASQLQLGPSGGFTFGSPSTGPSAAAKTGFSFGAVQATSTPTTQGGFSFQPTTTTAASTSGQPGFTFQSLQTSQTTTKTTTVSKEVSFQPAQTGTNPSKPGFTFQPSGAVQSSAPSQPGFQFGQQKPTQADKPVAFGSLPKPQASTPSTGDKKAPVTPPKFSLAGAPQTTAVTSSAAQGSSAFTFGSPKVGSGFNFGAAAAAESKTPATDLLKSIAGKSDKEVAGHDANKTVFGGFTFSSQPLVTDAEREAAKSPPKPIARPHSPRKISESSDSGSQPQANPFASFSFTPTRQTPDAGSTPQKDATSTSTVFGSAGGLSNLSFSSMAKVDEKTAFSGKSDFKGFPGAGQQMFGKSPVKSPGKDDDDGHGEEFEPDVDFKPVVPLPDLVEVKTGEEDEEKLFGERAKLFRLDPSTTQWKERGVGEMKILKHRESGRARLLMRREQVLKLCANHSISKEMKLQPMQSSDRAWCWLATDYSEGEMKHEKLAVKFKNAQLAAKFKEVFEECQKQLDVAPVGGNPEQSNMVSSSSVSASKDQGKSLSEMFKKKEGEWECDLCLVRNSADSKKCLACETPKPGCEAEAKSDQFKPVYSTSNAASGAGSFSFGEKGGFSFSLGTGEKETPPGGFTFGSPAPDSTTSKPEAAGGFKFGSGLSTAGGFSFGSQGSLSSPASTPTKSSIATVTSTTGTPRKNLTDVFGSSGFTFGSVTPKPDGDKAPPLTLSARSPQSPEGDMYVNKEGEDAHIYFEPVVPLPEKIDVKTGEEDEEVVYSHRAKLFRFTNNEWKERGVGDIKILRHKETRKVRMLMRREQVLKICLNHAITPAIEMLSLQNSQGKAWVWHANDFSEGEGAHEQFALRFKTADIANDFKRTFDGVHLTEEGVSSTSISKDTKSDNSDSKSYADKLKFTSAKPDSTDQKSGGLDSFSFKLDSTKTQSSTTSTAGPSTFPFSAPPGKEYRFGSTGSSSQSGFGFGSPGAFPSDQPVDLSGKSPLNRSGGSSLLKSLLQQEEVSSSVDDYSDEVEFLWEEKPTPEQIELAKKFLLPPSFYLYEKKPPCPGCIGCEDRELSNVKKTPQAQVNDVIYVGEEKPSPEQKALAQKFQLPDTFYLYEKKPSCPGCAGCESEDSDSPEKSSDASSDLESKTKCTTKEPTVSVDGQVFGGKTSGELSFAALAAKSPPSGLSPPKKPDSSKPFAFPGAGASLFTSPRRQGQEGEEGEEGDVAPSPDVHFEPVVPLPELVEVKTGEEDEEVLYCHRAKVYRFTDGQWKERGVGDLKLLRNPQTGKIRVLLRREQVLKLACHHYITPEMALLPMATSEVAWCYFAQDFTGGEPRLEQLAVKFKNKDIALNFKSRFEECQKMLTETAPASIPTVVEDEESPSQTTVEEDEEEYVDAHDDDDEDEDDQTPLFAKRVSLSFGDGQGGWESKGMGELMVMYDDDVSGARISMTTDDGVQVVNHIVCQEYHLLPDDKKKCCEWTAKDFSTDDPVRRTFKVQFSSKNAVAEFKAIFNEGRELARDSDIREVSDRQSGDVPVVVGVPSEEAAAIAGHGSTGVQR